MLPAGETGLLEARGRQLPGAEGAWLRTTDLATIDDDRFLFIRGRADEAINRGGFKIPPSVIEDALAAHPAVDEASAVGAAGRAARPGAGGGGDAAQPGHRSRSSWSTSPAG